MSGAGRNFRSHYGIDSSKAGIHKVRSVDALRRANLEKLVAMGPSTESGIGSNNTQMGNTAPGSLESMVLGSTGVRRASGAKMLSAKINKKPVPSLPQLALRQSILAKQAEAAKTAETSPFPLGNLQGLAAKVGPGAIRFHPVTSVSPAAQVAAARPAAASNPTPPDPNAAARWKGEASCVATPANKDTVGPVQAGPKATKSKSSSSYGKGKAAESKTRALFLKE